MMVTYKLDSLRECDLHLFVVRETGFDFQPTTTTTVNLLSMVNVLFLYRQVCKALLPRNATII